MITPHQYTHYSMEYISEGFYPHISFNLWNKDKFATSFMSNTSLDAMFFLNNPNFKLMNNKRTIVQQIKVGT